MSEPKHLSVLLIRASARTCALLLEDVIETMRPLPTKALNGMPSFVRGLATIRGIGTPVVDLGLLLEETASTVARYVTVRAGTRQVALAVDAVLGIAEMDPASFQTLPPLLRGARPELIETLGHADGELVMMLRAARSLPEGLDFNEEPA